MMRGVHIFPPRSLSCLHSLHVDSQLYMPFGRAPCAVSTWIRLSLSFLCFDIYLFLHVHCLLSNYSIMPLLLHRFIFEEVSSKVIRIFAIMPIFSHTISIAFEEKYFYFDEQASNNLPPHSLLLACAAYFIMLLLCFKKREAAIASND